MLYVCHAKFFMMVVVVVPADSSYQAPYSSIVAVQIAMKIGTFHFFAAHAETRAKEYAQSVIDHFVKCVSLKKRERGRWYVMCALMIDD
jgi:hypothetical protein